MHVKGMDYRFLNISKTKRFHVMGYLFVRPDCVRCMASEVYTIMVIMSDL